MAGRNYPNGVGGNPFRGVGLRRFVLHLRTHTHTHGKHATNTLKRVHTQSLLALSMVCGIPARTPASYFFSPPPCSQTYTPSNVPGYLHNTNTHTLAHTRKYKYARVAHIHRLARFCERIPNSHTSSSRGTCVRACANLNAPHRDEMRRDEMGIDQCERNASRVLKVKFCAFSFYSSTWSSARPPRQQW